jgi:hypothetical protein
MAVLLGERALPHRTDLKNMRRTVLERHGTLIKTLLRDSETFPVKIAQRQSDPFLNKQFLGDGIEGSRIELDRLHNVFMRLIV